MQVNTHDELQGFDGKPLMDAGDKKTPITLGMIIRQVMNSPIADEPWTPDTMIQCADLSRRALNETNPDFDPKERAMILERAAKVYAQMPDAPQIYMLLDEALNRDEPPAPTLAVASSDE